MKIDSTWIMSAKRKLPSIINNITIAIPSEFFKIIVGWNSRFPCGFVQMVWVQKPVPPCKSGVHSISLAKGSLILSSIHSIRCFSASTALAP